MDPAHDPTDMDLTPEMTSAPEPTALDRLQHTEGAVARMSGDIASLVQLGHHQQQQFLQHQQMIQQQQEQLTRVLQLLSNPTTSSGQPAPSPSAPAQSASAPSVQALHSAPVPAPDPNIPSQVAQSSVSIDREPKVGNPERFNGDHTQVRAFLSSCRIQFALQPRTFATEGAKVGYVITHLTGRARLWGAAEFDRQTPACASFNAFAEEMEKVFDLGSSSAEASQELMSIRQGNRTVADYSIDFRTLARRSTWNMAAQTDAFLHSLAGYIKDELVSHEPPKTLDEAIALAVRIDRRIQTRRRERGQPRQSATSIRRDATSLPPPANPQNQFDQTEPMEIGRTSLSPEERQRRLTAQLCLYCGGENHRVSNCPAKARAHRS